jgi:arylsulfatase A-like enzyme
MKVACLSTTVFVVAFAACGDKGPPKGTSPAPAPDTSVAASDTQPAQEPVETGDIARTLPGKKKSAPKLADSPTIDLIANRHRMQLYADASLIVPMAGEGLRGYTNEYRRPWGKVVKVDGKQGRALAQRAALLNVPWAGSTDGVKLALHVHGGGSGQKMSLVVNGKRLPGKPVPATWSTVSWDIAKGVLRNGDNSVQIFVGGKKAIAGVKSYGLFHGLALGPNAAELGTWPSLDPVTDAGALGGFKRMTLAVEIPAKSWFSAGSVGPGNFRISVTPVGGEKAELLNESQSSDRTERLVDLSKYAGQLVELELAQEVVSSWAAPRIAVEAAPERAKPTAENAILLVIDALRSDRLKAYNPDTPVRTPRMSGMTASSGVTFKYNQAASPSSPPSHGSIQTGMIPRVHGVVGDAGQIFSGTPMLSTQARDAGIAAGYYGNNPFGMARLEKAGRWTEFHQPGREGKGIDCTALMSEILDFAKRQTAAGKRFVVSSLPYEPHTPYRYHEGITENYYKGPFGPPVGKSVDGHLLGALSAGKVTLTKKQWDQLKGLYDGEVEYMDGCFGQLVDGLKTQGLADKTALIITSDHGEGMFEHGKMGHAFGHYAELADVPLIFIVPGFVSQGLASEMVSSHLDITPTMLDILGAGISPKIQGMSLVPVMRRQGAWTPRVVSLEYGRSYALRAVRWKYIVDYQGKESLFDLQEDPLETKNLLEKNHLATRYMRSLAGFFIAHRSQWKAARWGDLNNHKPAFSTDNK